MPPPRRRLAVTAAALAVLAVAPMPGALAETLSEVQQRLERTSAELAMQRTRAEGADAPTRQAGRRAARSLERHKEELLEREGDLRRDAVAAQEAALAAAATAPIVTTGASTASLNALPSAAFGGGVAAKSIDALGAIPAAVGATAGADAVAIDSYLAAKSSPLAGQGAAFVAHAGSVGLDPRALVAISGAESSFATYGPSQLIHNPFGLGPHRVYPSWEESIGAAARNLGGHLYLGAGRVTIGQISGTWAPIGAANDPTGVNGNWTRNVSRYYAEMGGDPAASIFTSSPALAPAAGVAGAGVGPLVANEAMTHLGVPYLWGGESPQGFDCSGLVQYLYARHGIAIPRVADAQARVGTAIPPAQLQAGDAVFFADASGYIGHEGLYIGDGSFIHAPRTGDVVKISSLLDPGYSARYAGARRYA